MTKEEQHKNWLETRRNGIGGSDISAILGLNPWRTPMDIYLSKVNPPDEDKGTLAMRIGTELEDLVARLFTEETGKEVQRYNRTIQNDMLIANVDRLVVPEGSKVASHKGEIRATEGVECKTSSDAPWDEVPDYYQLQVQWYMGLIPSITKFYVPVLFLKYKQFKVYEIERDNDVIFAIQHFAKQWWKKCIEGGEKPSAHTYVDCGEKFAKSKASTIEASEDITEKVTRLSELQEQIKVLEADAEKAKVAICEFMKDNDTLINSQNKVLATWKTNKDSEKINYKAICQELKPNAELVSKYTSTQAGARVFKLK